MPRTVRDRLALVPFSLALALGAWLAGCSGGPSRSAEPGAVSDVPVPATPIQIDGEVGDWPEDAALVADEGYVYFRVTVAGAEPAPLQAAPRTLAVWLDLDGDAGTGKRYASPPAAADLGVDYELHFSPIDESGEPGRGVRVLAHAGSGVEEISHDEIDLVTAPTHANEWFEGRVARTALGARASEPTSARAMFLVVDEDGPTNMWSDPVSCGLPRFAPPTGYDLEIPRRAESEIRVVSWNVLRDSPVENAGPFERVLQVLGPDIVLVQEWQYTPAQLRGWFTALVPGPTPWHAHALADEGVAIVSRYPITPVIEETIVVENPEDGEDWWVRCVGGIVRTPLGDVGVASLHLKCCGTAGSWEDRVRVAEAEAVNEVLWDRFSEQGVPLRVIGGDLNLVGSRRPLEVLADGLDADGSALEAADPQVMGDASPYTWWDASSDFAPGRLDYLLVSDSSGEVVRAFVFDTARLSDRTLARIGLDPTDSRASDHLPVIVDVRPRE